MNGTLRHLVYTNYTISSFIEDGRRIPTSSLDELYNPFVYRICTEYADI